MHKKINNQRFFYCLNYGTICESSKVPLTIKKKINISRQRYKINDAERRAVPGGITKTQLWPKNAI